jgi:thiol-disulfide isomerase/thioredoxin
MRRSVRLRTAGLAVAFAAGVLVAGCGSHPRDPKAEYARLDFSLKDPAGKDVRLDQFKGRPLIINFWATYCGPCKAEIPVFNDLVVEHKSQGHLARLLDTFGLSSLTKRSDLAVVGISYDDAPSDIVKFLNTTPMHYPVLVGLNHDDLMDAYDASVALPTTWVIRADGSVVAKNIGPQTREWFEAQVKAAF